MYSFVINASFPTDFSVCILPFVLQWPNAVRETRRYWLLWVMWSRSNPWSPFVPAVMCLNAPKQLWWTLCLEPLFTRSTPQCHFTSQTRIMSPSEIQLRDPSPQLCTAAQISLLLPLLKPLLAPQLPDGWKITALSAKCGRCFSRISWPREFCSSPPECKRGTLCCHPRSLVCLLSWMVGSAFFTS